MHIANRDQWLAFADAAWRAAGRPGGLDPSLVESDPIAYDACYYAYFERRFVDLWMNVYSRVKPADGMLIKEESAEFREAWRRSFSWNTIWKQLLPFFVYGGAVGVNNQVLVDLASYYCIAQAIPSTVIDRLLDEPGVGISNSDAAFSMLFYIKGLSGIRALELPVSEALEDCLINHTRGMYDIMLTEHARRFVLPPSLYDAISNYFSAQSRLLSSIFFGVLPRWAYLLAGKKLPPAIEQSSNALRSVRQLNDELSDVHIDLASGLVTLPWLYALEEAPELRGLVETLWQQPGSADAHEACRARLRTTEGMPRACARSLGLLSQSMDATMASLAVSDSFDISVLHNVRWAHITRIVQHGYEDVPSPRQPSLPTRVLTSASNPIVPVGGAGTVVVDHGGKVLMSLILKRGMLRWELPAGVAEDGESMEQTAQRETFEETGRKVDVSDAITLCWHYSRELGKGWMGIFFNAHLSATSSTGDFKVINFSALHHTRVNLTEHPGLYESVPVEECDFDLLRRQWVAKTPRPTAHESVLACGFVDWLRIPDGRIHPLHRQLLEALQLGQKVDLLVMDADTDMLAYDKDAPLYLG